MAFIDKYVRSVTSTDLRDDAIHHNTEALAASAMADVDGGIGALLSRIKYTDGTVAKLHESGTKNLAQLLREWELRVIKKGTERKWVTANTEWDMSAAHSLYKRVAHASLAYWLDSRCEGCKGAKQTPERRICEVCQGSGTAPLPDDLGGLAKEKTLDMVSELEDLLQSHNRRAAQHMRKS